jgi:hypothetical protein
MLKRLQFLPGVVKSDSNYSSPGRYVDAQWVRFSGKYPQKMGGWESATTDTLTGVCRGIAVWRDDSEGIRGAFGTHKKLYVFSNGEMTDITPLRVRATGTLTNPIDTANGSDIVTVNHTAHGQAVADWVTLTAAAAVGGVTVAGNYLVHTVPDANSYTIILSAAATSDVTGGGGSTTYSYRRFALGTDPITTTSGSSEVTIADSGNGTIEGDTVVITGATAVGGITLSGNYEIISAGSDAYVIDAGSAASSAATGGGSAVLVQYELSSGLVDNTDFFGYGVGRYGEGTYGTPRSSSITLQLRTWALWSYGAWLLASPAGGGLYLWDPSITANTRAVPLYGSPTEMESFFVTPERYIVALGTDGDKLKIRWPDQTDPTAWTSTLTNTANEGRTIQGGDRIIAGRPVRNQVNLIWTDAACFIHQWRPDDYVFTTALIAYNAGIWGPNASTVLGDVAYWVGDGAFWKWDGAASKLLSDDIRDWFFANVDRQQRGKVYMGTINDRDELIILYQETGQSEINRYLLYNIRDQHWTPGQVTRTAWLDKSLFDLPLATDQSGDVFWHETGVNGAGAAIDSFLEAAPVDVSDGENNLDIFGFFPDIEGQAGDLSLFVLCRTNAADTAISSGPFAIAAAGERIDLREQGKMVGFRLESNVIDGNWRMGDCRADIQTSGARR